MSNVAVVVSNDVCGLFPLQETQVKLAPIDGAVTEEDIQQRIDVAQHRRDAPADDSKMVDEMSALVDQSSHLDDGNVAPNTSQASDFSCLWYLSLSRRLHLHCII